MNQPTHISAPGHHAGHHHSFGESVVTGMAVGALLAWILKGERHPWLTVACTLGAFGSLLAVGVGLSVAEGLDSDKPPSPGLLGLNLAVLAYVFLLVLFFPARFARWEDAANADLRTKSEARYRRQYLMKIAEVATPAEMARLDSIWDFRVRSDDDWRFWTELAKRWGDAYPPQHHEQYQMRQRGWLCRCERGEAHSCRRAVPAQTPAPASKRNLFARLFVGPLLTAQQSEALLRFLSPQTLPR